MSGLTKMGFVLRRAWFKGVCTRQDIERAFEDVRSPAVTSRVMREAVNARPHHLLWKKRIGVVPMPGTMRPNECRSSLLLEQVASGCGPQITGIFEDDGAPILRPRPLQAGAQSERANDLILQASIQDVPLRILYVGLKRHDAPRWRNVWPCALEFTGAYWRLHAQDLEAADQGYPVKVFVIYRILEADLLGHFKEPAGFYRRRMTETTTKLRASVSEHLTPEQAKAVKWGLGIDERGVMTWPNHSLYEFKREWAGTPPGKDIVWPLLGHVEELP